MKEIGFLPDLGLLHPKSFKLVKDYINDQANAESVKKYKVSLSFSHGMECIVINGVKFFAAVPDREGNYTVKDGEALMFSSHLIGVKPIWER